MSGHLLAGFSGIILGVWWFGHLLRDLRSARPSDEVWKPRASWGGIETLMKLAVPAVAIVLELLNDTSVNNFQHATAYLAFFVSGVVDLRVARGALPPIGGFTALSGAFFITGLMFMAHGSTAPLSHTVHLLLTWLILATAFVILVEPFVRHPLVSFGRTFLTIVQGTWLVQIAWMLYVADYDLAAVPVLMRGWLFFGFHLMGVALLMLAWHQWGEWRRSRRANGRPSA